MGQVTGTPPDVPGALYSTAVARIAELEAENARLRIALHDAIRRPLGVTPASGEEFYDHRLAREAEERRTVLDMMIER